MRDQKREGKKENGNKVERHEIATGTCFYLDSSSKQAT